MINKAIVVLRFILWEFLRFFRNSVIIRTKQGKFKLLLASKEYIGRSLFCYKQFELDLIGNVTSLLRDMKLCPPKGEGVIWDIGANNGVISIGMLMTGEFSKALAIEPAPQNFLLLQENVELNNLVESIICLPYAISNHSGTVQFELSDSNYGDHRVRKDTQLLTSKIDLFNESLRKVITVNAKTLDDLHTEIPEDYVDNISLIWVDVQGYEGYVFLGAKKLLSKGIPVVTEFWPYGIMKAGMSKADFCEIVKSYWSKYWVWREDKFISIPTDMIGSYFDEIGYDGKFCNILLTP